MFLLMPHKLIDVQVPFFQNINFCQAKVTGQASSLLEVLILHLRPARLLINQVHKIIFSAIVPLDSTTALQLHPAACCPCISRLGCSHDQLPADAVYPFGCMITHFEKQQPAAGIEVLPLHSRDAPRCWHSQNSSSS
jgi:hypothetical protein